MDTQLFISYLYGTKKLYSKSTHKTSTSSDEQLRRYKQTIAVYKKDALLFPPNKANNR